MIGGSVTAIGGMIAALYSGGSWVDSRYAHQDNLRLIEFRLEQKIVGDRAAQLQQRIWVIEDRYGRGADRAPETVKEEYRRLQAELAELYGQLRTMQQKH